jgi:Domain of unknown function (DUF4189)
MLPTTIEQETFFSSLNPGIDDTASLTKARLMTTAVHTAIPVRKKSSQKKCPRWGAMVLLPCDRSRQEAATNTEGASTMIANSTPRNTAPARRRRITAATLLVAATGAIAVGALGPAAFANADPGPGRPGPGGSGPYVAIAYSPDNGAHGWANNAYNYQQAVDTAVANCTHFGGRCQLAAWDDTGCAALAVMAPATTPDGKWGHWSGRGAATLNEAQDAALNANAGGEILLSRCATGGEGQGT